MFFFNLNPRKRQLKLVTFTTQMRICTIDVLNLKKTLSFLIPFNKRLSSQNRNKPKRKTNASENQRDQFFYNLNPRKRQLQLVIFTSQTKICAIDVFKLKKYVFFNSF